MKYWTGPTAFSGEIRPLDIKTFKDLVSRQINVPVVIPMKRDEFLALSDDDKKRIKNGPYITACSFKEGTTHRCDANADTVNLLMYDLDGGKETKHFVEYPDDLAEKLFPYNFFAYHTSSSTPEDPRIRIGIDCKPCAPSSHKKCIADNMRRIGLTRSFSGYRESNVLSQPMYRPNSFLGEDNVSPVICSRTDGIAFDERDCAEVDPEDLTEEERVYAYEGGGDIGEMSLMHLPLVGITVEDITPAVNAIDPDSHYEIWCNVFAALRHQFREEPQAREAFDLAVDWSSRGTKFKEDGKECYIKWKSFRPDATGKLPVTIRSLFFHAMKAGWKPDKVADKVKTSVADWIEACESTSALMEEGCLRISAMPFPNAVVTAYLLDLIQKKLKKAGISVSRADLTKQLSLEKSKKRAEQTSSEPPEWLRPFYYVSSTNKFRNVATGTELIPESFDNTFSKELISSDKESESAMSGRPAVLPRYFALNQVQIERVDETIYSPLHGANADSIVELFGKRYLNTYLPSSCPLEDPERSDEAGKLFCEHMAVLIPEPEYQEILIDYIAHNVQHPGVKIPWAAVIQSAEGVGKGYLGRILMGVFGKPNVKVISPEILRSIWSDWQLNAIFSILEEIHIPGTHREAVMNAIKMAISDTTIPINKRNTSAFDSPNFTNYIGFSNFLDALHLKPTDRRWMVLYSAIQTQRQVLELNASGHFDRMEPLLGELSGALRHWLMNRKISKDFPRHGPAPKTKYRDAVIELSKNPLLVFIEKLIDSDEHPLIGDDVIHLARFEATVAYEARASAKPTKYLTDLGYEKHGTADIARERTEIWVNYRVYCDGLGTPEELLESRISEI